MPTNTSPHHQKVAARGTVRILVVLTNRELYVFSRPGLPLRPSLEEVHLSRDPHAVLPIQRKHPLSVISCRDGQAIHNALDTIRKKSKGALSQGRPVTG